MIDSSISNILIKNFGVPQGSILEPILLNLCVSDMKNILSKSQCIQYPHDSTIYRICKVKEVTKCSSELGNELKLLEQCSKNINFVFNCKRRNQCYFQHGKCHSTINFVIMTLKIKCNNQKIERVQQYKLLRQTFWALYTCQKYF